MKPPGGRCSAFIRTSGIATLTIVLQGGFAYEDTTGKSGQVTQGGLEWMKAGKRCLARRQSTRR